MSYLSEDELAKLVIDGEFKVTSKSDFDEGALLDEIKKVGIKQCFGIGLHFAIIGNGNNSDGEYTIDGKSYNFKTACEELGIKTSTNLSRIEPNQLTPKRIVRVLRVQIHNYFKKTGCKSFLYRKYGGIGDHSWIFPGAEHLKNNPEGMNLYKCYAKLDELSGKGSETAFAPRIEAILRINGSWKFGN